jgi:hypothetical protein
MNWKSTAAVSGATTLLATFFGWPPSSHQANAPVSQGQTAPVVLSDIQSEAARLQTRVRKELDYRDPTRNLFRFGERAPAARARQPHAAIEGPVAAAAPIVPSLPFALAGMATETVDGTAQRTAILSTPNDVVFVKSGDRVGTFTVTQVDETGVELTGADGSIRRLVLTP